MRLYKYRSGSKRDLEMIKNDQLYATPSHQLNDPCETLFEYEILKNKINDLAKLSAHSLSTENLVDQLNTACESVKNKTGIYSLSKNYLDELLWAYYANSHKGFCIEYDLYKLENGLPRFISHMDEVDYSKSPPSIELYDLLSPEKFLKKSAFTKSQKWEHEDEYRILFDKQGAVDYDYRAVESVYFGLNMPETLNNACADNLISQDCIMSALQGRGINYYKIKLLKNSYKLDAIPVPDKYLTIQKYKDSVKDIDYTLVNYDSYEWDIPKKIFDKTAEIIKREPYLRSLNSIHLSREKSNEYGEPIIFAGYYKDEECLEHVKLYFKIQDIEKKYAQIKDI